MSSSLRVLCATLLVACAPLDRPPDVILVVLDTTRADRLGAYGHERAITPNLDAFARDAVVYERAWSTSPWTLPSHASLLTGLYPSAHGAHITPFTDPDSNGDNPAHLREEATTLAELLAARGYATAAFAGAGWLAPEFGLLQGYEVADAVNNRTLPAEQISDRAIAWLRGVPRDRPLHLLVNYFDPHHPYDPQAPHDRFAQGQSGIEVPSLKRMLDGVPLTPEIYAKMLDLYDGEIEYMDKHVGRIFEALRGAGRYGDSMIVVLADHGELFGEHGATGHGGWLWEELVRIPLIVKFPRGREAGTHEPSVVSSVDVLTWIASELALELPPDVHGLPVGGRVVALAEEFPNHWFREAGAETDRGLVAGVAWPWKLIVSSRGEEQLYRLDGDPRELELAADPEAAGRVRAEIDSVREAITAPPPDPVGPMSPEAEAHLRELGYIP